MLVNMYGSNKVSKRGLQGVKRPLVSVKQIPTTSILLMTNSHCGTLGLKFKYRVTQIENFVKKIFIFVLFIYACLYFDIQKKPWYLL